MSSAGVYKLIRFLLTGGVASLVYAVVTYLFIVQAGLAPTLASLLGYVVAIPLSYLGQKFFTFRANGSFPSEFLRFVITQFIGLLLATGIMALFQGFGLDPLWGILAVIISVPVISFILMSSFVFRKAI